MRAVFYNHTGRASGAERVVLLALEHLDRDSVQPTLISPTGELEREATALGVPIRTIGELNARFTLLPHKLAAYAFSLLRTVFALRSEIQASGADIIHANSPRAGIAAAFATSGTSLPVVWHIHDELKPHPLTSIIRAVAAYSRRCSFVAVSAATAESFAGGSSKLKERIRVVHNAVDIAAIDGMDHRDSIRQELGLEPEDVLFGVVGQITPRKGQLELIRTFAAVAHEMPRAKLLVVGGPIFNKDHIYRQRLSELIRSLGIANRVYFLGHRSDAASLIKQLDAVVINSKSEAFVMVGLEAMACRTAVIATDVGGTREMIADGVNGLLIPAGDETALADALRKMYGYPIVRERFVLRARERVEKEFNIARFASQFHSALSGSLTDKTETLEIGQQILPVQNS